MYIVEGHRQKPDPLVNKKREKTLKIATFI